MPPLYADDETPTSPRGTHTVGPELTLLLQRFDCLSTVERRRLGRLVEAWYHCTTNGQVLLEELAIELSIAKA